MRPRRIVASSSLPVFAAGRLAKSGAYTVVAADRGVAFDLTSTFTLALPAVASVDALFFFHVNKRDGSGVVTIDPNGSELIDGLTTIAVYQESFTIVRDGSGWKTQGRPKGWVPLQRTDISTAAAAVDFTSLTDTELSEYEMRWAIALSSSDNVYFRFFRSGTLNVDTTYDHGRLYAGSAATLTSDDKFATAYPGGTDSKFRGAARFTSFREPNPSGGYNYGAYNHPSVEWTCYGSSNQRTVGQGFQYSNHATAGFVDGIRLFSFQTFTGIVNLRGCRK